MMIGFSLSKVKTILYCGDLNTGVLWVGGFDIVVSIIIIIWFLTEEIISFDDKKFEKSYLNYVIDMTCAAEAIRDQGSLNEEQILACGGCWDQMDEDTLSQEWLAMAKVCLAQYSPNISMACQEKIQSLEVGDDGKAKEVFACLLNYVKEHDPEKLAQAYVAKHQQIWKTSEFNFTLEQFEQNANEEGTTESIFKIDIIQFVFSMLILVVASLLTFGGLKEKPVFLIPWIVVYVFYILFSIIDIISGLVPLEPDWTSAVEITLVLIDCYSFFLVWSFRKQLLKT